MSDLFDILSKIVAMGQTHVQVPLWSMWGLIGFVFVVAFWESRR